MESLAASCGAVASFLLAVLGQAVPLNTWPGLWVSVLRVSFLVPPRSPRRPTGHTASTSFDELPFSVAWALSFHVSVWPSSESLRAYSASAVREHRSPS